PQPSISGRRPGHCRTSGPEDPRVPTHHRDQPSYPGGGPRMTVERQLDPEGLGDHIDRLYRAAWGLCGSREEAEDLVQETFERVLRRPRFLHSEDDLGYLLRVLRNTFFSARRAAGRRPQTAPLPDDVELLEDRALPSP